MRVTKDKFQWSAFQFVIPLYSVSSNTYRISGHLHCYLNSWGLAFSLLWPIKVHVKKSLAFDLGQYVYAEVIMQMFPTHLMQGIFKDQVTQKKYTILKPNKKAPIYSAISNYTF